MESLWVEFIIKKMVQCIEGWINEKTILINLTGNKFGSILTHCHS